MAFGGIDEQIGRKVDAYRQNPQALQQRYQQNNELLDLLALQKIKSEKESVANEMKMEMQQSPKTIAQQREAEVLELTKKEMGRNLGEVTREVGGTAQQQQAVQQKNMQRMAAAGPQPQPRPQAGPQQAMPNMARMAGGGIVAFQNGGGIGGGASGGVGGGTREAAAVNLLAKLQLTPQQYQALPPEGKRQVQQALQGQVAPQQQQQAMPNMARMPRMAGGGIVSFAKGGQAEDLKKALASVGETLESYQNMSPQQQNLVKQTIQGKSNNSSYLNRLLAIPAGLLEGQNYIQDAIVGKAGQALRNIGVLGAGEALSDSEKIPKGASKFPVTSGLLAPKPPVNLDGLNRPNAVAGTGIAGGQDDSGYPDDPRRPPPMAPVAPPAPTLPKPITAPPIGGIPASGTSRPTIQYKKDPAGLAALQATEKKLAKNLEAARTADPDKALTNRAELAGTVLGQDDIMKKMEGVAALRTARNEKLRNQRSPFDFTRQMRGGGGLGEINRSIGREENLRRARDNRAFDSEMQDIYNQTGQLSEFGIRKLESGNQAAKDVNAMSRQAVIGQTTMYDAASTALTADAKNNMQVDIANLEGYDRTLKIASDRLIANASNETKIRAENLRASIAREVNDLEKVKLENLDSREKKKIRATVAIKLEAIRADYSKIAEEIIAASAIGAAMSDEQKANIRKQAGLSADAATSRLKQTLNAIDADMFQITQTSK